MIFAYPKNITLKYKLFIKKELRLPEVELKIILNSILTPAVIMNENQVKLLTRTAYPNGTRNTNEKKPRLINNILKAAHTSIVIRDFLNIPAASVPIPFSSLYVIFFSL
jgi:hypothetical protein